MHTLVGENAADPFRHDLDGKRRTNVLADGSQITVLRQSDLLK
jgi:hypothetical protein